MVINSTMLDIGFSFDRPGNTKSLPADSTWARPSSSMQRDVKGTRCSLPAFMRPAGTVQEEPFGFIHSWSPKADAALILLQANVSQEGVPEIIFVK